MASLSLDTPVEKPAAAPTVDRGQRHGVVLVAGFADPRASDHAAHVAAAGRVSVIDLSDPAVRAERELTLGGARVLALVLFLPRRLREGQRRAIEDLVRSTSENGATFVAAVSGFEAHFGDRGSIEAEEFMRGVTEQYRLRLAVFRPGHVLSDNSRASRWLRRLGFSYPLVPRRLRTCFVDGGELCDAIENESRNSGLGAARVFTLLGPNRRWRTLLAGRRRTGVVHGWLTAVCVLLSLLLVGQLAALLLAILARYRPRLRSWNIGTLTPRSFAELLALYNPYNYRHVKVVGYNNGVNHFGQRFPGKTVVSVVHCDRIVRAGPDEIKGDCGATVRKARDFLAADGQELYVVPNYSYVCLGTSFFVPIHGSSADYSCVADTITKAVLYDPAGDRLMTATRADADFREHLYNAASPVLLLRLYLRVKDRSRYFVRREEREGPGGAEILAALRDPHATNVEVRKSGASSQCVQVYKYYTEAGASSSPALELPRDGLGRLWDRLEENPVTSFLMHALTRHLAFHVELFFTAEEFATFWDTHHELPLRKIQLRYIRRDGMPHSAFCDHDCVSADMFMFRRHRPAFEAYLRKNFAVIRANPGKHSM